MGGRDNESLEEGVGVGGRDNESLEEGVGVGEEIMKVLKRVWGWGKR